MVKRLLIRVGIIVAAMAAAPHIPAAQGAACRAPTKHAQVECLVNEARAGVGLPALAHGSKLQYSSRIEGVRVWRFGHTHYPGGVSWVESLRKAGALHCRGWSAGEALGWGYTTPRAVVHAWLSSPEHRAILLSPNFTRIGVAHRLGIWVLHAGACGG